MDLGLRGKRVLITGSTQGIGYAVARACLLEGATVVINGRTRERVESVVDALLAEAVDPASAASTASAADPERHPGGPRQGGESLPDTMPASAIGVAADVATAAGIEKLVAEAGPIDVLVNNAGIFDLVEFADIDDARWRAALDLHLMAPVRLAQALLPRMLDAGWGRIVFVGTESAVDVPGNMIDYGVSKAAALALANGLAKLTRGTEVTVNTVLGGPTYSDGVSKTVEEIAAAQGMSAAELQHALVRPTSLVQRFIRPEEVASTVTYLASPVASAINGAAVRVEGGVLPTML